MRSVGDLLPKNLNRQGIGAQLDAASVCRFADTLYPGLYRAVSVRDGVLKVEVAAAQLGSFRVIEGALLPAVQKKYPQVARLRVVRS